MYIKIFCGDSQKYVLLQSDNATLNKKKEMISSDLYPVLCAYIDVISEPIETKNTERLININKMWKKLQKQGASNISACIETVLANTVPNTPYELIIPVLSDLQESDKLNLMSENPLMDIPCNVCNEELSIVEVNGNTYITTGPIFIMNDDGKTIDRI